jgi:hypothetical protein
MAGCGTEAPLERSFRSSSAAGEDPSRTLAAGTTRARPAAPADLPGSRSAAGVAGCSAAAVGAAGNRNSASGAGGSCEG